jgi:hypothetical protein
MVVMASNDYRGSFGTLKQHSAAFSVIISVSIVIIFLVLSVWAAEKQWGAGGDALSWEDATNWFPQVAPTTSDDIIIDVAGANVLISRTFYAQTLTMGGRNESSLTSADFVSGTISPTENTDDALHIRKGGAVTLEGAGIITLKGAFKNSEETLPDEPAFMFKAE